MRFSALVVVCVLAMGRTAAHAVGLPDTGQTLCYDGSSLLAACTSENTGDNAAYPRQDGRFGRDAKAVAGTLAKIGGGAAGFDYTKVANNGSELDASAVLGNSPTNWGCTRDNITGLTWEVKVNDATNLRHMNWTYTWYSTDSSTNGDDAGRTSGTTNCRTAGRCDSEKFVADVNALNGGAGLCGGGGWRLPTYHELLTLVRRDTFGVTIDTTYFPNTPAAEFWSASTSATLNRPAPESAGSLALAWYVSFYGGLGKNFFKLIDQAVRLVRGPNALPANALCTAGNPRARLVETTPSAGFTDNSDGTVTHARTGLMWKRCAEGQSWNPPACTGLATGLDWSSALKAANTANSGQGYANHTDWRLPNQKELGSIVELCGSEPAINQTVFPNTAVLSNFWSSTSDRVLTGTAYGVHFVTGYDYFDDKKNKNSARLVRGGQSVDSFDLLVARQVVVEYLNTLDFPNSPGGHFFYSSDPAEQAAVDAGAAGKFSRTSRQFLTGGTSPVCRFYGSVTPGPNSHFFTVDVNECDALKAAQITPTPAAVQQWNYEGLSYSTTPASVAANGTKSCPAGTLPLYRAYNNAFPSSGPKNPWDSNHRFTPSSADIAELAGKGWRDEGIVFCTAQ